MEIAKVKNRGISADLANAFKSSALYSLYAEHKDELIVCIRHNYVNIYYHLNSIAELRLSRRGTLVCRINEYFLGGCSDKYKSLTEEETKSCIIERYEEIKHLADTKKSMTSEKICQELLFIQNNHSASSKWYCVDVEWARAFNDEDEKEEVGLYSRLDILAVSVDSPHRIAVIELKYGNGAIGGDAGVKKHIEDFMIIKNGKRYRDTFVDIFGGMKTDVVNILQAYTKMGITVPDGLSGLAVSDIEDRPEFFILTLDNNQKTQRSTLPKQTMAAYLFEEGSENFVKWDCKRASKNNVQSALGIDVLDSSSELCVTFLFSGMTTDNLKIRDIVEDPGYEVIKPSPRSIV